MTTINTTDDLLSLLQENQEFREAVRKAILTEELLALPAVFNAFASETRGDIKRLNDAQDRHTNDIGELKGIGLETKLYNRGASYVATLLSVYDIQRIRVAEKDDNSREFNEDIRNALRSGAITMDEYDRVLRTDMIVGALRVGALNPVYTAIEASYSVTRNDIRKVNETAGILGRVFPDAEIHSALCYMNIASFVEHEANQQGIHLLAVRHLE